MPNSALLVSPRSLLGLGLIGLLTVLTACQSDGIPAPNNVIQVTRSSAGTVAVVAGGQQTLSVTFSAPDTGPMTALTVDSGLNSLPAGWSAPPNFQCERIASGSGCMLNLTYAPTNADSGAFSLHYTYLNTAGVLKSDSIGVEYAATTHNNLVGTVSPTGQVTATVGAGSQAVTVTFTTDDGNPATQVALGTDLTTLPTGWSSVPAPFTCASSSIGATCQLALTYSPLSVGSGTLTLSYTYNDNSGAARTGNLAIPYAATANNSVVGTANPSGQITVAVGGTAGAVTVTFATDDGNPASTLSLTTDLTSLPAGWSSSSTNFTCGSIGSANGCQLPLTYAPAGGGSGTLLLNYSYVNDAGTSKTGSVSIPYVATAQHLYVGDFNGSFQFCAIGVDGTLSNCAVTAGSLNNSTAIAFYANFAYVSNFNDGVSVCNVDISGALTACQSAGGTFNLPFVTTISGNTFYAANANSSHTVSYCTINSDGSLSGCAETGLASAEGLAASNGFLYVSLPHSNAVYVCAQALDGSVSGCTTTGSGFDGPEGLAVSGGLAFVTNTNNNTVSTCTVDATTGALGSCLSSTVVSGGMDIVLRGNQAYVTTRSSGVLVCDVSVSGALSNCVISNGGATFGLLVQAAVH